MLLGAYPKIYPVAKPPVLDPSEGAAIKPAAVGNETGASGKEVSASQIVMAPAGLKPSDDLLDTTQARSSEIDQASEGEGKRMAIAEQMRTEVLQDTMVFRANVEDRS